MTDVKATDIPAYLSCCGVGQFGSIGFIGESEEKAVQFLRKLFTKAGAGYNYYVPLSKDLKDDVFVQANRAHYLFYQGGYPPGVPDGPMGPRFPALQYGETLKNTILKFGLGTVMQTERVPNPVHNAPAYGSDPTAVTVYVWTVNHQACEDWWKATFPKKVDKTPIPVEEKVAEVANANGVELGRAA